MDRRQINIIAHSLGVRTFEAVMLDQRKYKKLPDEFYRNYFNAQPGHGDFDTIQLLITLGYMAANKGSNEYFHVTDTGINALKEWFKEWVIYKVPAERDIEYLKHKIRFYCTVFYSLNYGKDAAEHIIHSYVNYTLKREYTSHTTTDVINRFKKDLVKFYGKA